MKYRFSSSRKNRLQDNFGYFLVLTVIFLIFFFKPIFLGYQPDFSDSFLNLRTHQGFIEQQNDNSSWQNDILSGYPTFPPEGIDAKVLKFAKSLIDLPYNSVLFLLLLGGFGMYMVLSFHQFPKFVSLLGAISFSFSFIVINFYLAGREDIMKFTVFLPWIIYLTSYLKKRNSLLGAGLLIIVLTLFFKDPSFHLILSLIISAFIFWVICGVILIRKGQIKEFLSFTLLQALAYLTAFTASAYPLYPLLQIDSVITHDLKAVPFIAIIIIYSHFILLILWSFLINKGIREYNNDETLFFLCNKFNFFSFYIQFF